MNKVIVKRLYTFGNHKKYLSPRVNNNISFCSPHKGGGEIKRTQDEHKLAYQVNSKKKKCAISYWLNKRGVYNSTSLSVHIARRQAAVKAVGPNSATEHTRHHAKAPVTSKAGPSVQTARHKTRSRGRSGTRGETDAWNKHVTKPVAENRSQSCWCCVCWCLG